MDARGLPVGWGLEPKRGAPSPSPVRCQWSAVPGPRALSTDVFLVRWPRLWKVLPSGPELGFLPQCEFIFLVAQREIPFLSTFGGAECRPSASLVCQSAFCFLSQFFAEYDTRGGVGSQCPAGWAVTSDSLPGQERSGVAGAPGSCHRRPVSRFARHAAELAAWAPCARRVWASPSGSFLPPAVRRSGRRCARLVSPFPGYGCAGCTVGTSVGVRRPRNQAGPGLGPGSRFSLCDPGQAAQPL